VEELLLRTPEGTEFFGPPGITPSERSTGVRSGVTHCETIFWKKSPREQNFDDTSLTGPLEENTYRAPGGDHIGKTTYRRHLPFSEGTEHHAGYHHKGPSMGYMLGPLKTTKWGTRWREPQRVGPFLADHKIGTTLLEGLEGKTVS
jgi:hypothetical protein